jgi:hypothetical protein
MRSQIRFVQIAGWTLIAGVLCYAMPQASAQFGGTNTTSSFGSRTLGGTNSANRTGRSTGASNSPLSAQQGNALSGANGGQGQGQGASTVVGGERFVRGNRQGAFVGADSSEATNSYSQQGAAGLGAMGGLGGMGGGLGGMMGNQMMMQAFRQSTQQNQTGRNQQQNSKNQLRPTFKVGFETGPSLTTTFTARQQSRYTNLPALKGKGNIEVLMEGDTLVLRGQVASAGDRKLAEDLLSLEPEVSQVRNELEIVPPASSPPELNPPARSQPVGSLGAGSSGEASAPRRASRPLER